MGIFFIPSEEKIVFRFTFLIRKKIFAALIVWKSINNLNSVFDWRKLFLTDTLDGSNLVKFKILLKSKIIGPGPSVRMEQKTKLI